LIDVREIVDRLSIGVFIVQADFVVEDSVEADILEIGDPFDIAEIVAIVVAEREDRPPGAKHFFPEVGKRVGRRVSVDFDGFSKSLRLSAARKQEKRKKSKTKRRTADRCQHSSVISERECIADMLDNTLVFAHHSSLHRAILSLSWPFEPLAPI
jgi:hypothetical protein